MDMKKNARELSVAKTIKDKIMRRGERVWRFADFKELPAAAVAQALSRLCRLRVIQRLGKGLYYKPRQTTFGPSHPSAAKLSVLSIEGKDVFPFGIAAANLLGFTTQQAAKLEVATNGLSLPRLLVGRDTKIHTRRPEAWKELSTHDAAVLDFLRRGGAFSELSPRETVAKLLKLIQKPGRFNRLRKIAMTEPPRVRAILGAISQQLGYSERQLVHLRNSINPLSKFDFGMLTVLKYAKEWQAKEKKVDSLSSRSILHQ